MDILYKDKNYIVCIKPSGIASQQDPNSKITMLTLLEQELKQQVYAVHRLDKPVAGLMVYACTKQSADDFSKAIQQGTFYKEYYAVLKGTPEKASDRLEDLLFHDTKRNKTYVVKKKRKGVRTAILEYQIIAQQQGYTLVRVHLLTGRTHQIRVQFASRGLPLIGDGTYGGGKGKIGLWSRKLVFPDPESKAKKEFSVDPVGIPPFDIFTIL